MEQIFFSLSFFYRIFFTFFCFNNSVYTYFCTHRNENKHTDEYLRYSVCERILLKGRTNRMEDAHANARNGFRRDVHGERKLETRKNAKSAELSARR